MPDDQLHLFESAEPTPDVYPAAFLQSETRPPRLEAIQISGLKAFDDTTIVLPSLAVLTGPNNSGKSTILQGIALGFECLRRCVDTRKLKFVDSGRSVTEFEFLPVNEPRDLWFKQIWKPTKDKERYVEIVLFFEGDRSLTFRIRFLFGLLNIRLTESKGDFEGEILKTLLANAPVLVPATPGPAAHEDYLTLASVHRMLGVREPSRVVRNILARLHKDDDKSALEFVNGVLKRYFEVVLSPINFDERFDLEIRAPVEQEGFALDIVSSGSGLNQILQLACIVAWRKPAIVLLDEPDAHLHSSVQAQLFDFLQSLVERYGIQVVLSTHSRDLISQAPLESIIPVDATRRKLVPLESLEHLLLEYQRFGALSNIDLAVLYQTKSCVFVEGPTDSRLLPRIAERCGVPLFTGPKQAVPFEFQGVDKLKYLPDLVRLFERLIGARLRWAVIRDSDSNLPEIKREYAKVGDQLGAAYFHQWERHSLENYLLDPKLLHRALVQKYRDAAPSEKQIVDLITSGVDRIEDSVAGTFVTRAQLGYRDFKLSDSPHDTGAASATRFLRELNDLQKKLVAYPGKRIFGAFVQALQDRYKLTIRVDDIVGSVEADLVPVELVDTLRGIRNALMAD